VTHVCKCELHGDRETTIVCAHICETLQDGHARGFDWHIDEDGEYQAVCGSCRAMTETEWAEKSTVLGRVLCFECFKIAAEMNGVDLTMKAN
jgi:hypothetical protein